MKKQFQNIFYSALLIPIILGALVSCTNSSVPPHLQGNTASTSGTLLWSDEFKGAYGATPDPSKWSFSIGGSGWGNAQLQYYTHTNAILDGQDNLLITADHTTSSQHLNCWYGICQYVSARLTTAHHFSFTYGELNAVITIPRGKGLWSAFWLVGTNCATVGFPACGEIDIAESKGDGVVVGSLHSAGFGKYDSLGPYAGSPHRYTLRWFPDHIDLLVDGTLRLTSTRSQLGKAWVFDHPFTIMLNLAVGGRWPGSPDASTAFPQQMRIQYVRLNSL